jgi:hypothetical protein
MNNKIFISMLVVLGLNMAASQGQNTTTFVDVSTLGVGIVDTFEGGAASNGTEASVIKVDQLWTRDKVYLITKNTIIAAGVKVIIEAGTLVRYEKNVRAGTGSLTPADPGALVVSRGGRLIAKGTAEAPIIMTSIDDRNVPGGEWTVPPFENKAEEGHATYGSSYRVLRTGFGNPVRGTLGVGEYTIYNTGTVTGVAGRSYSTAEAANGMWDNTGLWGGIVYLGQANITGPSYASNDNARTSAAVTTKGLYAAEGMAAFSSYAVGGGDNDADDQGCLSFVSNRYGGFEIDVAKELNAFSMYGVGYNTTLEFVEDWCGKDDSFEFWGGCNTVKYAVSAFCGDDGVDTDAGWVGSIQYVLQMANPKDNQLGTAVTGRLDVDCGDNLGEHDGPEGSGAFPKTVASIVNGTWIGRGYGATGRIALDRVGPEVKSSGQIKLINNIFMDSPFGGISLTGTSAEYTTTSGTAAGYDGSGKNILGENDVSQGRPYGEIKGNVWYRCGLAYNSAATGTPFTLAQIEAASKIASRAQMFRPSTARSSSGASDAAMETILGSGLASLSSTDSTALLNNNYVNLNPGFTVPISGRITQNSLAFTPTSTTVKDGGFAINRNRAPQLSRLTPAPQIGAVRDNAWYLKWTMLGESGIMKTGQGGDVSIEPPVTVAANGANARVSFPSITGVKYSVERSTDNKVFESIAIVDGNGGTYAYDDSAATGVINGTPKFWRVMAQ